MLRRILAPAMGSQATVRKRSTVVVNLKETSSRFAHGREMLHGRREEWGAFEQHARTRFERAVRQGKLYGFPDALYISSSRECPGATSQPWIRLFFGRRAVGSRDGHHLISEGGCALLFSQGPRGEVVAFAFPFKSETHTVTDEHLAIGHILGPQCGTRGWIDARIADLWSYAQVTSVEGHPSVRDSLRVRRMRLHHWCFGRSMSSILREILTMGARSARMLKELA